MQADIRCDITCPKKALFTTGLALLLFGLMSLIVGLTMPSGSLPDYVAAGLQIGLCGFGGGLMAIAVFLLVFAAVREPSLLSSFFSFDSEGSDIMYMMYSFGLFALWMVTAFITAMSWEPHCPAMQRQEGTGIASLVFFGTSPIWIASFFFFGARALKFKSDGFLPLDS